MSEIERYISSLESAHPLREPIIRNVIEALQVPKGSFGLDVGCGIGLYTLLLAEAVGPGGHVTGIDITEEFLEKARSLSSSSGIGNRTSFKKGDACKLPFAENTYDWACSMDFAGYAPLNPILLLKEMGRIVKPGGMVFISMWSSQKLLPGFPKLEAELNATSSGIAPFNRAINPEYHMMRALGWFSRAGLIEPEARTFVRDICPPLNPDIRTALIDLLQMRWGEAETEVAPEVWAEYQRLCREESPDFILNVPEYYGFFTYSLFGGRVV